MTANSANISASVFRLSPLIRITLLSLYIALTVPLPFLSQVTAAPVPPELLWVGISIGLVALYAVPRTTGQGGIVYYFLSQDGKAYLLPMRVAGFARLVQIVQAKTGIDTTDVRPLAQPWMYLILLVFTLLLLLVDGWAIATALTTRQLT